MNHEDDGVQPIEPIATHALPMLPASMYFPKPRYDLSPGTVTLVCSDGTRQILTKQEVIWVHMGLTSIEKLDAQYRTDIPSKS